MQFDINKGVGKPLDFFGLKNQYIVVFMVGVVLAIVAFFGMKFISDFVGAAAALTIALLSYLVSHRMNRKYGINGLDNDIAMKSCPERVSPRRARHLIRLTKRRK